MHIAFLLLLSYLITLSRASDPCRVYKTCEQCTNSSIAECIWCGDDNGTNKNDDNVGCMSGNMFGATGNASCPLLDWRYRQCTLPGFWVLFISASLLFLLVTSVVSIAVYCLKRKSSISRDSVGLLRDRDRDIQKGEDLTSLSSLLSMDSAAAQSEDDSDGSFRDATLAMTTKQEVTPGEVCRLGDWSEYKDEEGDSYYYNNITKDCVWEMPQDFMLAKQKLQQAATAATEKRQPLQPPPSQPSQVVEHEYTPAQETYHREHAGSTLVRTLYPFNSVDEDLWQLSFAEGEYIWVVDSHHQDEWWIGEKETGERGYFARSYVQILKRKIKSSTKQSDAIARLSSSVGK